MKHRKHSNPTSKIKACVWSISIELIITIILCAITAWVLHLGKITIEQTGYAVMMILLIAAGAGGHIVCRILNESKLSITIISAAGFFLTQLLITALFFKGKYQAILETGLIVLCGAMLNSLWGKHKNNRKKISHRKIGYR